MSATSTARAISDYLLTGMHHSTPEGQVAIAALIEHLVPQWSKTVPTKPGYYLRRFDKAAPVYMETYVLDPRGTLCYAADPDDDIAYGSPLGPRFQATTEWCRITEPIDPSP